MRKSTKTPISGFWTLIIIQVLKGLIGVYSFSLQVEVWEFKHTFLVHFLMIPELRWKYFLLFEALYFLLGLDPASDLAFKSFAGLLRLISNIFR